MSKKKQAVPDEENSQDENELEGIKELEDETHDLDKPQDEQQKPKNSDEQLMGPDQIQYERLSEFFFDLCLSWCQHLDIETYVFFLNGIFLNITTGPHINVSTFKEMDEIEVLSVNFFNKLLEYRNNCEKELENG